MPVDIQAFKQALSRWASGVTVVTTRMEDNSPKGMTASAFNSVSIDPPLVLVCIGKKLFTHSLVEKSGFFAVNILNTQQEEWGKLFAGMYPDIENRFAEISYTTAETGAPILSDVIGWMDCRVYNQVDAGDHSIFIGKVLATGSNEGDPLMYFDRSWGTFTSQNKS